MSHLHPNYRTLPGTMRYLRKFKADEITADDLLPIALDCLSLDIPQMKESRSGKNRLDQLPIRVKTRFRGGRNVPGRRVVSTPIFDLVTPSVDPGLLPPPMIQDTSSASSPKLANPQTMPKARRSLPPLPESPTESREKNLPSVPRIRQVSMPLTMDKASHVHNHSTESYTSIIEIYKQNAPFGSMPPSTHTHRSSFATSLESSPEAEVSSLSSGSEYSFDDSTDEAITKHTSLTSQGPPPSYSSSKPPPVSMAPPMKNSPPRTLAPAPTLAQTPQRSSRINMPKRKPPPKSMTRQDLDAIARQTPHPPLPPYPLQQRNVLHSTPQTTPRPMWDVRNSPPAVPTNYRHSAPPYRVVSQPAGSLYAN